jgi:hypothetical protein
MQCNTKSVYFDTYRLCCPEQPTKIPQKENVQKRDKKHYNKLACELSIGKWLQGKFRCKSRFGISQSLLPSSC